MSAMLSPWRSSPGASTHLPRLRLRPPPHLAHSLLLHHRPSSRRQPLYLVLLPPGRAGVEGGAEDAVVGVVGRPPRLGPLLSLLFPEVRLGRPSPTCGQGVSPCGPTRVREGGLVLRTSRQPWSRGHPPMRRLTSPVDTEWIADSGASYHTTTDMGILSSVRPPHSSCLSSIMVGDGSCLHVTSVGSAHGPFRLYGSFSPFYSSIYSWQFLFRRV
jgi:hypothetical protein